MSPTAILMGFKTLLPVIKKNYKVATIALLAAVIIYQNVSDHRWVLWADTIPHLRSQLIAKDFEIELTNASNARLTTVIEERNRQIEQWQAVSLQLEETTEMLQEQISGIRVRANQTVRTIIQSEVPETCSAAIEYLVDTVPEIVFSDIVGFDNELP